MDEQWPNHNSIVYSTNDSIGDSMDDSINDSIIENNLITGSSNYGIRTLQLDNVSYLNNAFIDLGVASISLDIDYVDNINVSNNIFNQTIGNIRGIDATQIRDSIFQYNNITNIAGTGLYVSSNNTDVSYNKIDFVNYGIDSNLLALPPRILALSFWLSLVDSIWSIIRLGDSSG